MNFLTRFSLKNPIAIGILATLFIVAGIFSFQELKVDLLPDVEFPQISVQATDPGTSPQDMEDQVTTPLEKELEKLEGLRKIDSSSHDSTAVINLEFPFDTDMDDVERQINTLVQKANLPKDASTEVNRFSFGSIPIYNIALYGKGNHNGEKIFTDEIKPKLEKIPGVNEVSAGGSKSEKVQVTLDRKKAAKRGITLAQVKDAIEAKGFSLPAGEVTADELNIPVRVEEKLDTLSDLKKLRIDPSGGQGTTGAPNTSPGNANGSGGAPGSSPQGSSQGMPQGGGGAAPSQASAVKLADIASVKVVKNREEYTRFNQKDALSIAITKKQDANTVSTADKVIKVLNDYKDRVKYEIGFEQAKGITDSVNTLIREGLYGALFASLAVLLFLRNVRATIIAIVSIPLSLLMSAIFLNQQDITLNMMTLGGMAVAVGRVVDDSIVVIENIFRRIRQGKGKEDRTELVAQSTREVLKAIVSSTLTTAVVFLPLGFVGGVTGEFFQPFALTVVSALLASLLVAVTIVPILGRFSFSKVKEEKKETWLQRNYAKVIRTSLNRKGWVIALSILILGGTLSLIPSLGFTFLPDDTQKTIIGKVELPASTDLKKTNRVSLDIEKALAERKDTIQAVSTGVGSQDFQTGLEKKNQANYFITLKKNANVNQEMKTLEKEINRIVHGESPKGIVSLQELQSGGPPSNTNVDIDLYSNNTDKLQKAASDVQKLMDDRDDLKNVTNNLQDKQRQWVVQIDSEKAAKEGISGSTVMGLISDRTRPVTIEDMKLSGKERNVELTYDKALDSRSDLADLEVPSKSGMIKLSKVADVKAVDRVTAIQKLDGNVYARVTGQVEGKNVQQAAQQVISDVKAKVDLPKGVSLNAGSGSEETTKTFKELGLAMLIAIGLVYLTMLVTFGKARIPFIILSSLIFVPVGGILGLYLTGEPLSISAMIGVLMLIGIVTTNAIVMVDRVGQNQARGMSIHESLMEAGKTRLRPILMTAFATIAALIPLALSASTGTLISKGLAVVVIGGLTSSTLLTLIIIPVMYELFFWKQVKKEKQIESGKESTV
ncbi:hydrophobic/amphiphilic exporter-1, HAE1 family [Marininema mesophilum]|uniref:Hydrophobic/amphiphilic exporter-1, HAE1 family n=1 Tax=Marininema mesophilum TaxID=1048340 RepID=A0A1H2YK17_9BACL|nr:efflux RND transporter permease subunit [Marininema mesophilum]SDX05331.1 hydrophobic/amphiphilic exporter-1, HAE1 family [Marininema mesophilum]